MEVAATQLLVAATRPLEVAIQPPAVDRLLAVRAPPRPAGMGTGRVTGTADKVETGRTAGMVDKADMVGMVLKT